MSNIIAGAIDFQEAQEAKAKSFSVEDVLKKIKEHTFSCVVAGGYCRDVFHGWHIRTLTSACITSISIIELSWSLWVCC